MTTLRIATFNLFSGRSIKDGRIDAGALQAAVASLGADVLAIQEVDKAQPRSSGVDQTALAAEALEAPHVRFVETVSGTPGEEGWRPGWQLTRRIQPASRTADTAPPEPDALGADAPRAEALASEALAAETVTAETVAAEPSPGSPAFGIAIVSRLPVREWHVLQLDPAPFRYPIAIPTRPPRILWMRDEPRAAVAAVLEEPRLTVACTHLSFIPGVNARQLRTLRRWLDALPGPHLLLGDFNLPAGIARRVIRWTPLVSAPTFPAPRPRLQIDHMLADGLPTGTRAEGRVRLMPISDHRAVVADLHLPGSPRDAPTDGPPRAG